MARIGTVILIVVDVYMKGTLDAGQPAILRCRDRIIRSLRPILGSDSEVIWTCEQHSGFLRFRVGLSDKSLSGGIAHLRSTTTLTGEDQTT